jgi:SpoVK/Ycf46/Vps4 family AAA+-type ATPase
MPLEGRLELSDLVPQLIGSSGADIVFVAKEAAMCALRRSVDVNSIFLSAEGSFRLQDIKVQKEDFIHALDELSANKMENGYADRISGR